MEVEDEEEEEGLEDLDEEVFRDDDDGISPRRYCSAFAFKASTPGNGYNFHDLSKNFTAFS